MSRCAAILFVVLVSPTAASAQDDRGASVGGSVSATNMDSRTSWSFGGSFEYRFNRVVGLEVEATAVPDLESDFPGAPIIASFDFASSLPSELAALGLQIFPPPRFENPSGRAVIFTNNVRVHIPTTSDRLDPFFVAGGGIASVRHSADFVFGRIPIVLPPGLGPFPVPRPQRVTSSTVDLALTIGGGVGVRAASHLWIEGDLRLFRLLGEEDRNVGRFGVGVRYRF